MRVTVAFDEVWVQGTKTGICPECGKRATRKERFSQTQNPFNKDSEGNPKSVQQINQEIMEKRAVWLSKPCFHKKCEDAIREQRRIMDYLQISQYFHFIVGVGNDRYTATTSHVTYEHGKECDKHVVSTHHYIPPKVWDYLIENKMLEKAPHPLNDKETVWVMKEK